jgi:hypothetical protein
MRLGTFAMTSFAASGAGAVFAIIVALLVSPSDFGFYGRLQAIGLVAQTFVFLRLERAILSASGLAGAMRATVACMWLGVSTAVLATAMAAYSIDGLTRLPDWPALLTTFLFSTYARGLALIGIAWLRRLGLASEQPLFVALQVTVQFAMQLWLTRSDVLSPLLGLLIGEVAGSALAIVVLARRNRWRVPGLARASYALSAIRRWWQLVVLNMPAAFLSQALVSLPTLTVGKLATSDETGHVVLAIRLVDAPLQILAATMTTIALTQGWHRHAASGRQHRMFYALYVGALIAACAATVILGGVIADVFHWERLQATVFALPYAAMLCLCLQAGSPMVEIAAYRGREAGAFALHGLMAAIGLAVWILSADPHMALIFFAATFLFRSACFTVLAEVNGSGLWRFFGARPR